MIATANVAAIQGPERSMNFPAILATIAKGIPYIVKLTPTKSVLAPKSSMNLAHIASYIPAGKKRAAPKRIAPNASLRRKMSRAELTFERGVAGLLAPTS